jgi:hypothetical protein
VPLLGWPDERSHVTRLSLTRTTIPPGHVVKETCEKVLKT